MNRWENKVAIITGTTAGIGEVLAELLVEAGIKVVGLARRKERLDSLAKRLKGSKGQFHGLVCDVSKEKDILEAFRWVKDKLGPIHILVNNAGIGGNTNLVEGDTKIWENIFQTNVIGLCIATREAVKDMRANKVDGHIIHINSVSGHGVTYFPQSNVYPASKFAVTALTETLRRELNLFESKIKISSVSPGIVQTEFKTVAGLLSTKEQQEVEAKLPLLQSKDVADAVIYVLSTPLMYRYMT